MLFQRLRRLSVHQLYKFCFLSFRKFFAKSLESFLLVQLSIFLLVSSDFINDFKIQSSSLVLYSMKISARFTNSWFCLTYYWHLIYFVSFKIITKITASFDTLFYFFEIYLFSDHRCQIISSHCRQDFAIKSPLSPRFCHKIATFVCFEVLMSLAFSLGNILQ